MVQSNLRTTSKVSSVMRTIPVMIEMFPAVVSGCLVQGLPYLEVSPDDLSVDIREQLLVSILEQRIMNVSMSGSGSSVLDATDKALFEGLGSVFGHLPLKLLASLWNCSLPRSKNTPCNLSTRSLGFRRNK